MRIQYSIFTDGGAKGLLYPLVAIAMYKYLTVRITAAQSMRHGCSLAFSEKRLAVVKVLWFCSGLGNSGGSDAVGQSLGVPKGNKGQ